MRLRLHTRVGLGLLATGLTLLGCTEAPHRVKAPPPVRGSSVTPTKQQLQTCLENQRRGDGAADCTKMTKDIQEDDPWGRWDCATMGNRVCAPTTQNLEDLHRPGCFMEPSSTPSGWETIWYPDISKRGTPGFPADDFGFEIPCPTS